MGFMLALAALLIVGAMVGVVAQRRSRRSAATLSDLDAEAEANGWLVRLGGSLSGLDVRAWARADENAAQSLTHAAAHHRTARAQLASARTSAEYAAVSRTAAEGLRHVEDARAALGIAGDAAAGADPRLPVPTPR
ncbi:hypothetical protein ACGFNV_24745 [Streptomyces sp. NPDC048751]|uniref:hypothetical protein n=1 Tax=Streptomyces sp. NPDC048751 TaxID=3365591 RepID=UPI003713E1F7